MKYINWLIDSLLTLAFLSCMDDKGSYDYTKLDEPVWKLREGSNTIWVECRAGEMAKFKSTPFFTWQGDSAARAANCLLHQVDDLVKLLVVNARIVCQNVVVDVLQNQFPIAFKRSFHFRSLLRGNVRKTGRERNRIGN